MLRFIKERSAILATFFLVWFCWSVLASARSATTVVKEHGVPIISVESLRRRQAGESLRPSRDPTVPVTPYLDRGLEDQAGDEQSRGGLDSGQGEIHPHFEAFSVRLESILVAGGTREAMINNRVVHAGDTLPGLDSSRPPVVEQIDPLSVAIRHRGRLYRLDLATRSSVTIQSPGQGTVNEGGEQ